jgi:hypothetical protein
MKSIVENKAYAFALRIIKAYKFLSQEQREFVLSIHQDCDELIRLLVSIVKTSKENHGTK